MATVENFKVKVTTEGVDQLDKLGRSADFARDKIAGLTTAILGVSFGAFVGSLLDAADRVVDLSDATGIAVVNIKAFEDAMASSGGKAKNAEKAILAFTGAIESANDGSLKSRDAFAKVGVSLTDLKNLSEQDLLQKTVEGLSQMAQGSERTAAQATLLGKSFRGVDVEKFIKDFESGKITLQGAADAINNAAAANDALEKKYRTLQIESMKALEPILDLLGKHELTATAAKVAIYGLAAAMALAFGASVLSSIKTINSALGITAGLANIVGKSPLGIIAKLAATGAVAAGTAIEIEKLISANDKLTASEDNYRGKGFTDPRIIKGTGNANRTQELDARQKAALESEKRIEQSIADIKKSAALASANELMAIQINAESDIEKAKAEIYSKENLSKLQKDKEFAVKRAEIEQKAALDTAKYRREIDVKIAKEMMDQAEQDAKDWAAYYKEVDQARLQAFGQVDAIKKQGEELQARFELQQSIVDLGTIEQDRQTKLFDLEQQRKQQLESISKIPGLQESDRIREAERLNALYEKRVELINKEADTRVAREQDFSAGVKESMKRYSESLTPLKQGAAMADSVYNSMGSAVDRFVETGKFKFSDFATSVVQDLIKIQMRAAATQLFNSVLGTFGFGLPGRAAGGPVLPNTPYIVGERGPEVFLPKSAGNIVPNNKLGSSGNGLGGGTSVVYNINAVDSMSFKQLVARDPGFLYSVTEQGRKTIPSTRR
jgi:lambda family phage tail tape measure protein